MAATATNQALATTTSLRPRVLVVDDEPMLMELMDEIVAKNIDCRLLSASSVGEARKILASQPIELLVADVRLPDGDGMSLVSSLGKCQPQASAMVVTGAPSVDNAIQAMRSGAVDFLAKPFSADTLIDRVRLALRRQQGRARVEKRLVRLRDAVKRLNEARKVVSKKVDLLCNDLIGAYGELSRQFDRVRTQEGFRKYVGPSNDLEQMLCHAMDWLLRQVGYSNVAIFLAGDEARFQLGAYMKYTIAGNDGVAEAMASGLVPRVIREGFVHLRSDEAQDQLSEEELRFLSGQQILAVSCTYLAEPLAAIVLFRGDDAPLTEEHAAALQAISPIFAVSLASAVRHGHGEEGEGGIADSEDEDREERRDRGRSSDADWWKRGEQPPF